MTAYLSADVVDLNGTRLLRTGDGALYTPDSTTPESAAPTATEEPVVEGVGPVNQHEQSDQADKQRPVTSPLQRWATRRLAGRSATATERSAITNPRRIQKQQQIADAAELERIQADPDAQAYSNRRSRTVLLGMSGIGIGLGVSISSATAQSTITAFMGWAQGSFAALAAYGADPALGLVLFAILGLRALASTRGVSLPNATATAFTRIEAGLFALVAVLNVGPSLGHLLAALFGGRWGELGGAFMVLVIHALGPVLVAAGVYGVPHMLAVFDLIRTATARGLSGAVGPINQHEHDRYAAVPAKWHDDLTAVLAAIDAGALPLDPNGSEIYKHLGGGDAGKKKHLRDAVAGYRPEGVSA